MDVLNINWRKMMKDLMSFMAWFGWLVLMVTIAVATTVLISTAAYLSV